MKPRAERIETIRRIVKAAKEDDTNQSSYTVKNWRGKSLYRKIVQIDSEYLMFRIENSRTEIQQLAYIRKHSLHDDFFNDPESVKVQEAQEQILVDMLRTRGKDLLEDLKLRKQDDACIITYDGYLVNGNRRTSGLKDLRERYIDCIVLPEDASPKDIYLLEQQLQISQDFREDYHWINELRNIRKGKEDSRLELTEKELAVNLRLEVRELKTKLSTLDLVDSFLLWKKVKGQYDYPKLDDTEEIFRQLEKAIKKYAKDDSKREALQYAVFTLIEERPSKGRLYGHVMDLIGNFDQIYVRLQKTKNASDSSEQESESDNASDDLMDDLVDDSTDGAAPLFDDSEDASESSGDLQDVIADVKAANKERKDAEAVYEGVSSALRELQGLSIDNDTSKIGSVENKLEQIILSSERLLAEIKGLDN